MVDKNKLQIYNNPADESGEKFMHLRRNVSPQINKCINPLFKRFYKEQYNLQYFYLSSKQTLDNRLIKPFKATFFNNYFVQLAQMPIIVKSKNNNIKFAKFQINS